MAQTLPETMMVMAIPKPGGPEALVAQTRPLPTPGPGEILIRVAAAGVNRPDVLQRQGHYPPPPGASDLPGLEVAGEVVALGAGAARLHVGDKVCALVPGGGYAQFCKVHATNALPIPKGLSLVEAAAIPETFFTVWTNVFDRGHLHEGETFLVHGGSSGIGTTAIMLAKAFGARVFTTAGSAEKCESCRALGADLAIDYRKDDFVEAVKGATQGKGVDLILDMVGGDYVPRNYEAAAEEGRIVQIAFLKESTVTLDLRRLMMKRLVHTGSTLRPRTAEQKARIAKSLEEKVWPLLEKGRCKPVIHATFRLTDAPKAHALMESSTHIGKIVLTVE
ncbi:MAG: NAD(P)H-quinone oxidoreductase [Hyphomicrobiales bacterium]|nr:NAD(P)H-quinone oxidoreductase [Hyphomicrobiales bacterium]MBV9054061.1 NAD(P)H-quinone oxidoreductase [Hyphomicrobiales bacterium]